MQENYRLIEFLEKAGWEPEQIIRLLKYVASGNQELLPTK